jgi:geranylgeranyl diphosphate synthase type II
LSLLATYLSDSRARVLETIRGFLPDAPEYRGVLYELMLDYPLRDAKALRPALCIATCRALGGQLDAVLPSAAVLEFFHNAFLIHDDIEDLSEMRRGAPTLHARHGVPIAINVGDAMLALALQPLLDNTRRVGLGKSLRILETVATMCRESVEGQALELDWIKHGTWALAESDYVRMVGKKTSWYTFVAPVRIGAIAAGCAASEIEKLAAFAMALGTAFQIQDDVLNLDAGAASYGKELAGDLWEGKRTLILLHALANATAAERERAVAILKKQRSVSGEDGQRGDLARVVSELVQGDDLSAPVRARLQLALAAADARTKSAADVATLFELVERHGSLAYARAVSRRYGERAAQLFEECAAFIPASVHREFLSALMGYVSTRDW